MKEEDIEKHIIMLLLLNKNNAFSNSYSLIRALSRWFAIINLFEIAERMIKEGLLTYEMENQIRTYKLSSKAAVIYKRNSMIFEKAIKEKYPTQLEIIEGLLSNISE